MTASQPSPTNLSDELKYILSCVYYAGVQSTLKGATIKTPTMSREDAKAAITTAYAEAGYRWEDICTRFAELRAAIQEVGGGKS